MNVLAIVDNIVENAIDRLEASKTVLDFTKKRKRRKVARLPRQQQRE